ncbi:MAG TPA: glycoside hydrolase family 28 protein [Bryobacteraceae bacterium]|jgi:polygalacturonase|nr:glycoside hydrolase family 28 protein [Bryobacteraceae bacterium]
MKLGSVLCGISLAVLSVARLAAQTHPLVYEVRSFGAAGDGKTLDTAAINRAITAAHAAGGGTVYFSAGTYESGSIHLASNVALYFDQGAVLEATKDPQAYDEAEPNQWSQYQDFGHSHFHNSLMWGEHLENISIFGPGRIVGAGLTREGGQREGNKAIALKLCHNVIIRDVSFLMCGHFAILATGVDNLTISGITIDSNRDGIDIDSCQNVRISDSAVNTPWDDAIVLKATHALGYARATENVTITNCEVSGYDNGTFLGGTFETKNYDVPDRMGPTGRIKIGTESEGDFKNITISNCVFARCRGLALETVDGAHIEDVSISNITMRDVVNAPIFLRLGARMRAPEGVPIGSLQRVNISNVVVYNANPRAGALILGIPGHDIEDVTLGHIKIYYQGGGTKEEAAIEPPELEKAYPEPQRFGETPVYGFYIRHVKGIELNDVEVRYIKEDLRPAIQIEDTDGAKFIDVDAQHAAGAPVFVLKNVSNFSTHDCAGLPDMRKIETTTASYR